MKLEIGGAEEKWIRFEVADACDIRVGAAPVEVVDADDAGGAFIGTAEKPSIER